MQDQMQIGDVTVVVVMVSVSLVKVQPRQTSVRKVCRRVSRRCRWLKRSMDQLYLTVHLSSMPTALCAHCSSLTRLHQVC